LKIGTKLILYLSLIIILVLAGYGYLDILSRQDMLIKKMKTEVRSTGRILKLSLEKISLLEETAQVGGLIEAMSEYERTLGVIVFYQEGNLVFRSHSLEEGIEPYLGSIKRSIREDRPQEGISRFFIYVPPQGQNRKEHRWCFHPSTHLLHGEGN